MSFLTTHAVGGMNQLILEIIQNQLANQLIVLKAFFFRTHHVPSLRNLKICMRGQRGGSLKLPSTLWNLSEIDNHAPLFVLSLDFFLVQD